MPDNDVAIRPVEHGTVVTPAGPRLDAATSASFKNAVVDLINAGTVRILLDLAGIAQIDSSGLGALISIHKTLQNKGGKLILCAVPERVQPILKLTRLDRIIATAPNIEAAKNIP